MPEPIWSFVTHAFTVRVDALPEVDLDLSWDETGEVAKELESGRYTTFYARAQVLDAEGRVLAANYLGNCIYESTAEFGRGHRDPDPLSRNSSIMRASRGSRTVICHYFPDMVRTVCRDARATLHAHAALYLRPVA